MRAACPVGPDQPTPRFGLGSGRQEHTKKISKFETHKGIFSPAAGNSTPRAPEKVRKKSRTEKKSFVCFVGLVEKQYLKQTHKGIFSPLGWPGRLAQPAWPTWPAGRPCQAAGQPADQPHWPARWTAHQVCRPTWPTALAGPPGSSGLHGWGRPARQPSQVCEPVKMNDNILIKKWLKFRSYGDPLTAVGAACFSPLRP